MIEKLIEYSIRNRFLVMLVAAALTVFAIYAVLNTPVDAIPDLSENQVIVFTDWMGRSPRKSKTRSPIRCRVKLQGLAGVKAVRSSCGIQLLDDHHHLRRQHRLLFRPRSACRKSSTLASTFLPAGRGALPGSRRDRPGPDLLVHGRRRRLDPSSRSCGPQQDSHRPATELGARRGRRRHRRRHCPWSTRSTCDPESLRAYGITLGELYAAVAKSNSPVGGGVIQKNNAEYLVRGVGWIKDKHDIENTVIKEVRRHAHLRQDRGHCADGHAVPPQRLREGRQRSRRRRRADAPRREPAGSHPGESRTRSRNCSRACRPACASCRPTTARD